MFDETKTNGFMSLINDARRDAAVAGLKVGFWVGVFTGTMASMCVLLIVRALF